MHLRPMLVVRSVEASLAFYRHRLGFELVEALEDDGIRFWAYVKRGTAELMLTGGKPDATANGSAILYLYPESVAELETLHAELSERGEQVSALETTRYGHRLFTLTDPDGYTWTVGRLISPDLWPDGGGGG